MCVSYVFIPTFFCVYILKTKDDLLYMDIPTPPTAIAGFGPRHFAWIQIYLETRHPCTILRWPKKTRLTIQPFHGKPPAKRQGLTKTS